MKSPYLLFLLIIILFLSCAENQEDQILNMGEQGFLLDRSIFPRGNNVAKSAVVLEDTYLIGGQLFNKTDSSETESSIIKLSASGEIIKQVNFGGRRARLEYLLQTNDSKIIATGYQKGRFWLREIDQNLIVLFDSTYQDIDFNGPLGPIFFETQDGFLLISTSFRGGRRTVHFNSFSKDYKIVSHHTLEGFCEEHGFDEFGTGKYDFDPKQGLLYLLGSGYQKEGEKIVSSKQVIMLYDVSNLQVQSLIEIDEDYGGSLINVTDEHIILTSRVGKDINDKRLAEMYVTKDFDFEFNVTDKEGNEVKNFKFLGSEMMTAHCTKVIGDKIYFGGEIFDDNVIAHKSLYFVFNLDGNLLEKRVFDQLGARENRIYNIEEGRNGEILLLGKGGGWRITTLNPPE